MKFIETSAKDSENVEKIFQEIAETLTKQANELYPNKSNGSTIGGEKLNTSKISTTSCCPV